MKFFCYFFLYFLFFHEFSFAQKIKIDSLINIVSQKNTNDSSKIVTFIELSEITRHDSIEQAFYYINVAIEMSKDQPKFIKEYCIAKDKKNYLFSRVYNYSEALQCLFDALKVIDLAKDAQLKAHIYTSIGHRYNDQENYEKALEHYQKSIEVYSKIDPNHEKLSRMYNNKANTYLYLQEYEKALAHLSMAFAVEEKYNNPNNLVVFLTTMGEVFLAQKQYQQASKYLSQAINLIEKNNLSVYNSVYASIYNAQALIESEKITEAYENLQKASNYFTEDQTLIYKLNFTYALFYKKTKNFEKSLEFYEKASILRDSLQVKEASQKTDQMKANYDFQIENALLKKENEQRNFQRIIFVVIIVLTLLMVFILVYNNQKTKKINTILENQKTQIEKFNGELETAYKETQVANEELYQTQEEILSQRDLLENKNNLLQAYTSKLDQSINAAKTIQKAILPPKNKMQTLFGEYFVLFKPKDVVSGDFWWADEIELTNSMSLFAKKCKFLIVADCTGHGISGAMLTMIGASLLDRIIRLSGITSPALILEKLHFEIKNVLQQEQTNNSEGMDIAVAMWHNENEHILLSFAAAKRPLYYVLDQKVEKLAGTRRNIGGKTQSDKIFEEKTLILPKNTSIYLCSDGYADQNNQERKSFSEKSLLEILQENQDLPLPEQKEVLKNKLTEHMINSDQRDDILIIGIKI